MPSRLVRGPWSWSSRCSAVSKSSLSSPCGSMRWSERPSGLPRAGRSGEKLSAGLAPLRFLVERLDRLGTQGPDGPAVGTNRRRRELAARWFVHEGNELVGEPGHRAADADAADIRAAAHAV